MERKRSADHLATTESKSSKSEKKTCTLFSRHVALLTNRIKCASSVADIIMSFNKCCKEVKMRDYIPRYGQVCRRRDNLHYLYPSEIPCANFKDKDDGDHDDNDNDDPNCLSCPFCVDWPFEDSVKDQCDACNRPLCAKCQTKYPCNGCDGKRFFCSRCITEFELHCCLTYF